MVHPSSPAPVFSTKITKYALYSSAGINPRKCKINAQMFLEKITLSKPSVKTKAFVTDMN